MTAPCVATHITRGQLLVWGSAVAVLLLILWLQLLPALLGGLAVYELVIVLERRLRFAALGSHRARALVVAVLGAIVIALLVLAGVGLATFFRHSSESLPALMQKLAQVLNGLRDQLPAWIASDLPADPQALRQTLAHLASEHTATLSLAGREVGRVAAHIFIGMILGALLALRGTTSDRPAGPLAETIMGAAGRFGTAFRQVVFAQAWIALVNATFTALYLLVALPAAGVHLPLAKSLILLTLVVGLIPIVGNLISNTAVILVSLTASLPVAAVSLAFLIGVHKLEYFLNARIIGSQIRARAWELLLAMLVMEAAFGIAGLVAAPIYYAYFKREMTRCGLV